jgi:thiol-disulfide isomerase/thioredoxin
MKNLLRQTKVQKQFLTEKYTILVIFRTWCSASRLQIPELIDVQGELENTITSFDIIYLALDREYGYLDLGDAKINFRSITEYIRSLGIEESHTYVAELPTLNSLKTLSLLNNFKQEEITPTLVFINKTREVVKIVKGLHKESTIKLILTEITKQ